MVAIVKEGQSIWDIAIEYTGSIEGVFPILVANGKKSDDINTGDELIIPAIIDRNVVEFFRSRNINPASLIDPLMVITPGGICPVPPPTLLQINSQALSNFPSGSTVDVQLTDGVNPIVPDDITVSGNVVTVEIAPPTPPAGWVRNPDWLPLPEITAADNRSVMLFIVFENEINQMSINANNDMLNVDWGDGNSIVTDGSTQVHNYNYDTITSAIHQWYDGRNYKQVIIDITPTGSVSLSNLISFDRNTGINNGGTINIVDFYYSFDLQGNFSAQRRLSICERFVAYKLGFGAANNTFNNMPSIKVFDIPPASFNQIALLFRNFGEIEAFPSDVYTGSTSLEQAFTNSRIRRFPDFNNVTRLSTAWSGCVLVTEIGTIDADGSSVMNNAFNGCLLLPKVVIVNCQNITNTTNAFNNTINLSELILQGIRVGFDIRSTKIFGDNLEDLFQSLGTANGTQTITLATWMNVYPTTTATNKGFTIAYA